MKLLFVAKDFYQYAGGGEICLKTFLNLFTKEKHFCKLITENQVDEKRVRKLNKYLETIAVPESQLEKEVLDQVNSFKPDFIGGQHYWGIKALARIRNIQIPKIFFLKIINFLEDTPEREFFRLYPLDLIVANSKYSQIMLLKSLGLKSLLSYPLINTNQYLTKTNSKKYITVVNYKKEKGRDILRKIARLLPEQKFLAVRSWEKMTNKGILRENNVTVIGPVKDMRQVYRQTKLLLAPSLLKETFGRVILEAAINGIPVIASNVGGQHEALGEGGILVDNYQNAQTWARLIKKFDERNYYQKISLLAKKRAQKYDYLKECQIVVKTMEELLVQRNKFINKSKIKTKYLFYRLKRFIYFKTKALKTFFKTDPLREIFKFLLLKTKVSTIPASIDFGFDRGGPVDRYYIEKFLKKNKNYIKGRVLEIGDDRYTKKFGDKVVFSDILNVNYDEEGSTVIDDLDKMRNLRKNYYDCFICTHVYPCIFDVQKAVENSLTILKKGGVLLLTVPGICPISLDDYRKWGVYWSFTDMAVKQLLNKVILKKDYQIEIFGNLKAATSFLYGYSWKELPKKDLDKKDIRYQIVIAALVKKNF